MFVSFLMPFPIRGTRAPFLWVLYRQLGALPPGETVYVGDEDYFRDPADHVAAGRVWDFKPETQAVYGYHVPTAAAVAAARRRSIPAAVFDPLRAEYPSPDRAWIRLLTADYPPLSDALTAVFSDLHAAGERVEAALTWGNCPSLVTAAGRFGIPVVHHELGALRRPGYRAMVYLDFRGVNGNTEAADRYAGFRADPPPLLSRAELAALVTVAPAGPPDPPPDLDLGLALQVENDSNLLAFADGYSNQELYWTATRFFPPDRVAVRQHPAGHLDYRRLVGPTGHIDDSPTADRFIRRCRAVATINSSVGLEAMLLGRPACILGDSPFRFAAVPFPDRLLDPAAWPPADLNAKLNFAVLGYQIPDPFLFDVGYYRWRLGRPSEADIYHRHLAYYRSAAAGEREAAGRQALEEQRAVAERAAADARAERDEARVVGERAAADFRREQEAGRRALEEERAEAERAVADARAERDEARASAQWHQGEAERASGERAEAQAALRRAETELQHARERVEQAEAALRRAVAARQTDAARLAELEGDRDRLGAAVDELTREIAGMRSSKFWKLRRLVRGPLSYFRSGG